MISVVVATYNGEKFIEEQLKSIWQQTRKADEVIITDDASSDGTINTINNFIEKYDTVGWKLIEHQTNQGFNANFYAGLKECKGDIIFLADHDDVWLPQKIEVMAKYMEDNPSWMMLSSAYTVIDGNGNDISAENVINAVENDNGELVPVSVDSQICCSYIRGCATCLRNQVVEKADWNNLSSILGHDWTLSMTAALLGKNWILHQRLFQYRFHGDNASLTAVTRKNLIGDKDKRIVALQKSIQAHQIIVDKQKEFPELTESDKKHIKSGIRLEKKRLKFFQKKNFFQWVSLGCFISDYKRYYHSLTGAIKVWVGDFLYAYNINFKTK